MGLDSLTAFQEFFFTDERRFVNVEACGYYLESSACILINFECHLLHDFTLCKG